MILQCASLLLWFIAGNGLAASLVTATLTDQPGSPSEVSFNDALRRITAKSTGVQQGEVAVNIARERQEQSEYIYAPDLSALGKEAGSGTDHGALTQEQTAELNATINVYRFGGDQAKRAAAKAQLQAAASDLTATSAAAALTAAAALFEVIDKAKERDIAKAVLAANQGNLQLAAQLYAKGLRPAQEVEKVAIDIANVEARLADAELQLAHAEATLAALAGEPVAVKAEWPWRTALANPPALALNIDLTTLPERRALADRAAALHAQLGDFAAKRLPSLDFTAGYDVTRITLRDPSLGYNVSDLRERKWSGTLVLTVPLFDRFLARTDYAVQVRQEQMAQLDLVAKDRALSSDYAELHDGFIAALASAWRREETATKAKLLYERSVKNFEAGYLSANELNLDQNRLYDTELNVVRGWAVVHKYFAQLCHILDKDLTSCAG